MMGKLMASAKRLEDFTLMRQAVTEKSWRRERDSNPRYGFCPYNALAGRPLRPLGHLSGLRPILLRYGREPHGGAQAPPMVRFTQGDLGAMRIGDSPDDGQAQAAALGGGAGQAVEAV